jgi:hypothetical protein
MPRAFLCLLGGPNHDVTRADHPRHTDASHAGHQMGKVFFVEPKDGATLSSKQTITVNVE